MAGRKPIPTEVKKAANNPGKRALNGREPQPRKKRPKIPAHLTPAARLEWGRVMRILSPMGVITEAEADILAVYCGAYARWVQCNHEIERDGLILRNAQGQAMRNPLLKVADDAERTMLRVMSELGMSPSARVRLTGPVVDDDPLEAFLRGTR